MHPFIGRDLGQVLPPVALSPPPSCQQLGQDAAVAVPDHWVWQEGNPVISARWNGPYYIITQESTYLLLVSYIVKPNKHVKCDDNWEHIRQQEVLVPHF